MRHLPLVNRRHRAAEASHFVAACSSRKRWRVVEIIAKATLVAPVPEVEV